jgi:plastocyanin
VSTLHVIANGIWQSNGLPQYQEEAGAPKVQLQVQDKGSHQIGPFTTAGTFHFYCTVHQGMSLTVVVR